MAYLTIKADFTLLSRTGAHLHGPWTGRPLLVSLGDIRWWPDGTWAHTSDITGDERKVAVGELLSSNEN